MIRCERMSRASAADARALLGAFLREDAHYRASSGAYGDGGAAVELEGCGVRLPLDASERPELPNGRVVVGIRPEGRAPAAPVPHPRSWMVFTRSAAMPRAWTIRRR